MYVLPNKLFFGSTRYNEMWSIEPVWPGWVIETVYNESTLVHDLTLRYVESDTVSQIKHIWPGGIS